MACAVGNVETFVFMDFETSGFKQHGVNPEITELFMLAVGQGEFCSDSKDKVQNSLRLSFNTQRPIPPKVSDITGLNADNLRDQKLFDEKAIELLNLFLYRLQKPVCLLAHNGNRFDFALLQAELKRFQQVLMPDLLCADTLQGFKLIEQLISVENETLGITEDFFNDSPKDSSGKNKKTSFALGKIYTREFPGVNVNAHRAESDVKMMYEIALKKKPFFVDWIDQYKIEFTTVNPM